jgi:hypothetical protein
MFATSFSLNCLLSGSHSSLHDDSCGEDGKEGELLERLLPPLPPPVLGTSAKGVSFFPCFALAPAMLALELVLGLEVELGLELLLSKWGGGGPGGGFGTFFPMVLGLEVELGLELLLSKWGGGGPGGGFGTFFPMLGDATSDAAPSEVPGWPTS